MKETNAATIAVQWGWPVRGDSVLVPTEDSGHIWVKGQAFEAIYARASLPSLPSSPVGGKTNG